MEERLLEREPPVRAHATASLLRRTAVIMVKVGTKIEFNYGAMHPREHGVVIKVKDNIATIKGDGIGPYGWPEGDIGFTEEVNLSCIRRPGETTINGSPIGVFALDADRL